jgi:transcriptional regulator with XRE-family HTH domain
MSKGAQLLYRWRLDKNLTQHELSKTLDVETPRISKYENGMHKPNRQMGVLIEKITQGIVTCASWDEEPYPDYVVDPDLNPKFDPLLLPEK